MGTEECSTWKDCENRSHSFLLEKAVADRGENIAFSVIVIAWGVIWLYLAADSWGLPFGMRHDDWSYLLQHQESQADGDERPDAQVVLPRFQSKFAVKLGRLQKKLDDVNREIRELLAKRLNPLVKAEIIKRQVENLKQERDSLEKEVQD